MTIEFLFKLVFWASIGGLAYTYAIYPFVLGCLSKYLSDNVPLYSNEEEWPRIDVVMAMYNEADVIADTLQSIVDSDYPKDKLRVVIGSDNSSDRSHEIVEEFQNRHSNVSLEIFSSRNGKIKIINSLVSRLEDDEDSVLILCDANVRWSPQLARSLARRFKDPKIGVVASIVLDGDGSRKGISGEEEAYVNLENKVKFAEGVLWGRMMGAFGACYAMRRKLYRRVPEHYNVDDFFLTISCFEQGYHGIVDRDAICMEAVSEDIAEEFRRKRRISKGNFQNLGHFARILFPWTDFRTSFVFWSHKGLRWFGPSLLFLILITGLFLNATEGGIYFLAMSGLAATMAAATIDNLLAKKNHSLRLFRFFRYFYVMNGAMLAGGIEFCRGVKNSVWEPTKRVVAEKS